jgi:uncharacterized protein (TIGR02147 family)
MRPIFDYLDYRDLLRDSFEERRVANPLYTYKMLGEEIGLHTSNVFRVLQKETHLPARCQSRAVEFLGLTDRTAAYFLLLVGYARERGSKARQEILEKAMAMRDVHRMDLGERQLDYFRDWWIAAVRGVLEMVEGRPNPAEISRQLEPTVTEEQVESALRILRELGLVKKGASGRLLVAEPHLSVSPSEEKVRVVRQYQRLSLGLAAESLDRFPPVVRDVTTLTMAVDQKVFLQVRGMLQECRRLIQKSCEDAKKPDRVMQLVMGYFPLTKVEVKP